LNMYFLLLCAHDVIVGTFTTYGAGNKPPLDYFPTLMHRYILSTSHILAHIPTRNVSPHSLRGWADGSWLMQEKAGDKAQQRHVINVQQNCSLGCARNEQSLLSGLTFRSARFLIRSWGSVCLLVIVSLPPSSYYTVHCIPFLSIFFCHAALPPPPRLTLTLVCPV